MQKWKIELTFILHSYTNIFILMHIIFCWFLFYSNHVENSSRIEASVRNLMPILEADFLYNITPEEFWEIYSGLKQRQLLWIRKYKVYFNTHIPVFIRKVSFCGIIEIKNTLEWCTSKFSFAWENVCLFVILEMTMECFWCEDLNFQYCVIKINIEKLELLLPDGEQM